MDHITPVLIRLHWLPVEYWSQYKLILCVFKVLHGLAPVYLTELVKPYVPSRSLRSQSASLLQVPTTRTKIYGNRRFDKTASTLWNNIPLQLKIVDSLSAFKACLKHIFLSKLFVCKYSIWHRIFWTFMRICRLLLMILWYLPYLDPFSASFWITSPNLFLLQPPFTISAPTIILWHSYSLPSLVSLLPTPSPLFCLKLLIGLFLHSHHPIFHFYFFRLLSTAFKIIIF
jgi:hypothetical protein